MAFGVAGLIAMPAMAEDVDFGGKRITMVVPFGPGGGADAYARFLVPFLQDELPGKPTIVVQNDPGAGSIAGANRFHDRAKPDGLTIMSVSESTVLNYVLGNAQVKYDIKSYPPIVASPQGTIVYVRSDLGVTGAEGIKDLAKKKLVIGANGPLSGDIRVLLSLHMLGLEAEPVFGLNRGPIRLGFERGEFNISFDSTTVYQTDVQPMVDKKIAVPLFSFGLADAQGRIGRDPNFPDVPTFIEVYKTIHGKEPSGPAFEAWMTFFDVAIMNSKAILMAAGTPDDVVKTYRSAMERAMKSDKFQKESVIAIGTYSSLVGDAAAQSMTRASTLSEDAKQFLRDWLKQKYDVTL